MLLATGEQVLGLPYGDGPSTPWGAGGLDDGTSLSRIVTGVGPRAPASLKSAPIRLRKLSTWLPASWW